MAADAAHWVAREEAAGDPSAHIDFQAAYIRDLVGPTDYPEFDIEGMGELFKQWTRDKQADILGYRNKSYRSTMTGTLSPPHHTPWMEAMDDSLEAFLADPDEVQEPVLRKSA
jgi:trimethylamine monooxygenase